MHKRIVPLLLAALLFSGCAATRPLVDRTVTTTDAGPTEIATADPATDHAAATVNWGGQIIGVNTVGEDTELEILSFPVTGSGRPDTLEPSDGRFIAVRRGFTDPLVYDVGRVVSVVGKLREVRSGNIGAQEYRYPVIEVIELVTVPPRRDYVQPYFSIGVGVGF